MSKKSLVIIGDNYTSRLILHKLKLKDEFLRNVNVSIIGFPKIAYNPDLYPYYLTGILKSGESFKLKNTLQGTAEWTDKTIEEILPAERNIKMIDGSNISYDYLVISPNSVKNYENIPGTDVGVENFKLPIISTSDLKYTEKNSYHIQNFKGGKFLSIVSTPIKSQVLRKYNMINLMLDSWRSRAKNFELLFQTTILHSKINQNELESLYSNIEFEQKFRLRKFFNSELKEINAEKKKAIVEIDGKTSEIAFDLLDLEPNSELPNYLTF